MKLETKQEIVKALEEYLISNEISANDLAKNAKVNSAYISNMRSGNFSMNAGGGNMVDIADKYFEAVAKEIGHELEKSYWETVPTPQMKRIVATLEDAKAFGYTNVVIGETGSGKTFVAEMFDRRFPLDCFMVKVSSQDNIGDLLEKVCDKLHIATEKSKSRTLRAIIKKMKSLKADGYSPMIIFDESIGGVVRRRGFDILGKKGGGVYFHFFKHIKHCIGNRFKIHMKFIPNCQIVLVKYI